MAKVNESIINFAVYENAIEYYGMAELTLPEITNLTAEVTGAGIAGAMESVILGHIEAMSMTMNFRTLTKDAIALHEPRDHTLDLRAAQQSKDTVSGKTIVTPVKHVMTVKPKRLSPGKLAPATAADASGEYAVSYWAQYIDGAKVLEIDVLNFIYIVNGVDYLAQVRTALGK